MTARSDHNKAGNIGPAWDADCDQARGQYLAELITANDALEDADDFMTDHLRRELGKVPKAARPAGIMAIEPAAGMAALRALGTEAA